MINQEVRYAVVLLKEADLQGRVTIQGVSRRYGLSEKFLEGIAGKLRTAGFLKSQRGRRGGYGIAAQHLSVLELLHAFGRAPRAASCSLGEDCKGSAMCQERELEARMIGQEIDDYAKMNVLT